ncbi:radiation-inducible immediate-early gene IEX-1 [Stigmatopora argus]
MYSTSCSATLVCHGREGEGFCRRDTQPEVFTFEPIPPVAARPKKRCARVMYPAKVRMHLPPPEKSAAKRCLFLLLLVLLWQIYTEEPCCAEPTRPTTPRPTGSIETPTGIAERVVVGQAHAAPVVTDADAEVDVAESPSSTAAGNSYVVALLVYHRLGADS